MAAKLDENIKRIADYTMLHDELQQAHHFLYDKRYSSTTAKVAYIVMGINPGETCHDWKTWPKSKGTPTQATSAFDLHDGSEPSRSAKVWRKNCEKILGTLDIALAEAFFWSSRDVRELEGRYGRLKESNHLKFCTELNKELVSFHDPKAVVVVGLGHYFADVIVPAYNLKFVRSVPSPKMASSGKPARLIEHYQDASRPWFFTKHWTGARASKCEKIKIANYIARHSLAGSRP